MYKCLSLGIVIYFFKINLQDQGSPPQYSDAEIKVNVIDADDQNPRFITERYAAVLPTQPLRGSRVRLTPHDLAAQDQDKGINAPVYYTFNAGMKEDNLIEDARQILAFFQAFFNIFL